jgi:hypothetical protein
MGDFHSDVDMQQWGRNFCTRIYELCTNEEIIKFTKKLDNHGETIQSKDFSVTVKSVHSSTNFGGAVPQGNTSEGSKGIFRPKVVKETPNPILVQSEINDPSIKELNMLITEYCTLNTELQEQIGT